MPDVKKREQKGSASQHPNESVPPIDVPDWNRTCNRKGRPCSYCHTTMTQLQAGSCPPKLVISQKWVSQTATSHRDAKSGERIKKRRYLPPTHSAELSLHHPVSSHSGLQERVSRRDVTEELQTLSQETALQIQEKRTT